MKRPITTALACILAIAGLTGCSDSAGTTTCDEYAAMTVGERSSLQNSLLREHGLDPYAVSNAAGLSVALMEFCDLSAGSLLGPGQARANNSSPLDDAVDWDSPYW